MQFHYTLLNSHGTCNPPTIEHQSCDTPDGIIEQVYFPLCWKQYNFTNECNTQTFAWLKIVYTNKSKSKTYNKKCWKILIFEVLLFYKNKLFYYKLDIKL